MVFTIEVDGTQMQWDAAGLTNELSKVANSPAVDAIRTFASKFEVSLQTIFNQLTVQVLNTDDKDLISLFRRAVSNFNMLYPSTKADPIPLYNKHYQPPHFLIPFINITLRVDEEKVEVTTILSLVRNSSQATLILNAYRHHVLEVWLDGKLLSGCDYSVTQNEIILFNVPQESSFNLTIKSIINPFENKSCMGLYVSGEWLTTQCESEGARSIFPTFDRPDVLSCYKTTIIADFNKYPYCISNGNLIKSGPSAVTWEDPFPKPSYLFAVVMGDFGVLKSTFTTRSGKNVLLEVFMEKGKEKRAAFSLEALKLAMKYDEEHFDREYDLDSLKMVAIPDFNSGAMENKGLMIFNESSILVDPESGTDMDYFWVASTISHEYCHNWSGNRVTVIDWFQLALKEAFTDFRSSQFMEGTFGSEIVRPMEAKYIKENQFPQDAKPSAHPIQIDSYTSVSEIYDDTTYVKGREVFRMLKTLLNNQSEDGFRVAQNAYFARFDGQAVTFEDLLNVLQDVSKIDLSQFKRWFYQTGTPKVSASLDYDKESKIGKITLRQTCPHPKTNQEQEPFHIPLFVELLDCKGNVLASKQLIELKTKELILTFEDISQKPIPVFHHDFSAPIHMEYDYTDQELEVIVQFEKDPYARSQAVKTLQNQILQKFYKSAKADQEYRLEKGVLHIYRKVLSCTNLSPLAKVEMLKIPSIRSILQGERVYDFDAANRARERLVQELAGELEEIIIEILKTYPEPKEYKLDKEGIEIRSLRNLCFAFLAKVPDRKYNEMIFETFAQASNFNNQIALLAIILEMDDPRKDLASSSFYEKWKEDSTVFCNWIDLQTASSACTPQSLNTIFKTKGFLKENPNHMRSLIRVFVNNLAPYHLNAEETYRFVTDRILEFGEINPDVAAFYLAEEAYQDFAMLPAKNKALMKKELQRLSVPSVGEQLRSVSIKILSNNGFES